MGRYVGLDVHSKHSVYVIQDERGQLVGEGSVPTTIEGFQLLRARYELSEATRVALESGTMAFFVARRLTRLGFAPLVVDAHEVRQKALRPNQKSDRRDALELCEGLRRDLYRTTVHVPPEAIERLRETLGRRRHFVRLKTMEVNAVKRLLRATGLPISTRCLSTPVAWDRLLKSLEVEAGLCAFCASHRAVWQCAHEQVALLDASLCEQGRAFQSDLTRLQTVPGVGPIVATTMLAAISDVSRFPSAKHVASYAGLVASTYDSGESVRHGHITRRGSSEMRAMLCEAAHHAGRPSSPFHPYFTSLCARRGHKMAVVAVAHRLCRIMFTMLRKGEDFDITKLGIEQGHFEQKIVRRYRRKATTAGKVSR